MGSINLIAARRAEHLRLVRITRGLTLSCLAAAGCLVGIFTLNSARIIHTNVSINRVEGELTKLKPTLDRIQLANQERQALRPKLLTLVNAQSATLRWYDVLDGLKRAIPPNAWLTSLAVEGSKEAGQSVRFNGVTVSQKVVGETMLRLNEFDFYKGVDLHFTQAGKVGERNTVEFEVAAQLKPLEGQKYAVAQAQTQ
jgi:Tfp pilus assembly protein PilN